MGDQLYKRREFDLEEKMETLVKIISTLKQIVEIESNVKSKTMFSECVAMATLELGYLKWLIISDLSDKFSGGFNLKEREKNYIVSRNARKEYVERSIKESEDLDKYQPMIQELM